MNTSDLTYLLNKPEAANEKQTIALENIVLQYPYFQAARALHLKGLYHQESFRYNYELKKTAAYTTDRTVLFEFITSENFTAIQQHKYAEILEIETEKFNTSNKIKEKSALEIPEEIITNDIDDKYLKSLKTLFLSKEHENENIEIDENFQSQDKTSSFENIVQIEEKLEIGKPLPFTTSERHSFQEWLQLAKFAPINRDFKESQSKNEIEKQKKLDLIDKFIEANPKIAPVKDTTKIPVNINKSDDKPTHLMTETLAKVYLEQKKYSKAMQAYEILILKYPEKSSFFANRINEIKNLQQNNNN